MAKFVEALDVLESLNDSERQKIMDVLQRDLELQTKEAEKIGCLRQEIQLLRRHSDTNLLHDNGGSLKKSLSPRHCRRCGVVLGLFFKSGSPCPRCRHRVCVTCRKTLPNNKWICVLCYKNREYAAVTGEWFFSRGQKQTENDYSPAARGTQTTASGDSVSGAQDSALSISKTLLKELQKAEKRRQVNSVKTADEFCFAKRGNRQQNCEQRKKPNVISTAMKEVSSLMTSPQDAKRPSSWHPNHLANMVLALTNRKDKTRPLSIHVTSDDDSVQSAEGISVNHQSVIPSVKVDGDCVNSVFTERKLSNALRSPSVPFLLNDEFSYGSAAANYKERRASKCAVQKVPSASKADSMNRKMTHHQMLSPIFNQKWASDLNLAASGPSNRSSVASNADDNSSVISGDSIDNKNTLKMGSVFSLTSLYSNAGEANAGKFEIKGRVLLLLVYDCKAAVLDINVRQCEDLAAVDAKRNRSNPYVKTYLLPDRSTNSKRKTKVKRHTVNPTFEETLKYSGLTKSELENRTLLLSVWHNDRLGRNDFLGETHIALSDYPWGRQVYGFWYDLQPKRFIDHPSHVEENSFRGALDLSIKFAPPFAGRGSDQKFGSFQCLVRKASHLQSVRSTGAADPFVKAYLHPITAKSTKQKSQIIKNDLNPVWNCSFEYGNVNLNVLKQSSLELTVWDRQRFGSNEFLGGIRLNLGSGFCNNVEVDWMDAREKEQSTWRTMVERPNVWCDATIPLRASMSVI